MQLLRCRSCFVDLDTPISAHHGVKVLKTEQQFTLPIFTLRIQALKQGTGPVKGPVDSEWHVKGKEREVYRFRKYMESSVSHFVTFLHALEVLYMFYLWKYSLHVCCWDNRMCQNHSLAMTQSLRCSLCLHRQQKLHTCLFVQSLRVLTGKAERQAPLELTPDAFYCLGATDLLLLLLPLLLLPLLLLLPHLTCPSELHLVVHHIPDCKLATCKVQFAACNIACSSSLSLRCHCLYLKRSGLSSPRTGLTQSSFADSSKNLFLGVKTKKTRLRPTRI